MNLKPSTRIKNKPQVLPLGLTHDGETLPREELNSPSQFL